METPANVELEQDVVVRTHYIGTFALALVFIALVVSAIPFLLIDF